MDEHYQSVVDGLATGAGVIGVLGFAIDANKWPILLTLVAISIALPTLSRKLIKGKSDANISTK